MSGKLEAFNFLNSNIERVSGVFKLVEQLSSIVQTIMSGLLDKETLHKNN